MCQGYDSVPSSVCLSTSCIGTFAAGIVSSGMEALLLCVMSRLVLLLCVMSRPVLFLCVMSRLVLLLCVYVPWFHSVILSSCLSSAWSLCVFV